jgi:hypothetical protein
MNSRYSQRHNKTLSFDGSGFCKPNLPAPTSVKTSEPSKANRFVGAFAGVMALMGSAAKRFRKPSGLTLDEGGMELPLLVVLN